MSKKSKPIKPSVVPPAAAQISVEQLLRIFTDKLDEMDKKTIGFNSIYISHADEIMELSNRIETLETCYGTLKKDISKLQIK